MDGRWSVARTTTCLVMLASARCIGIPKVASASWVESLVMPGEVIAQHARIERECDKCHSPFDKAAQSRLCLDCHKEVAADVAAARGYHGRNPSLRGQACKKCHTDHIGRRAQIVHLDRTTFNHRWTDLPLRGGHVRLRCDNCHRSGKRYRDAPSRCSSCHTRNDPHKNALGAACESCHAETSWKDVRFDHDAGAFPLLGRHRHARCDGCHATKRYKPTPRQCSACHERDDKHHGSLGIACAACHTAESWSTTRFDHTHQTRFPLVGAHARTACGRCHTEGTNPARTPMACQDCHARDDTHHGMFGGRCETCHSATGWRRHTFEHDRRTRFPLRGRHAEIRCTACHHGSPQAEHLDTSCYACHRADDVHHGQEGTRCETCHEARQWRRNVLFDHDLTRFPLLGAHARVVCADCHASAAFKDVARDCASCHTKDDFHRGRLGARCDTCHNPVAWKAWTFDHDTQTAFKLDGAHATLACAACHREPIAEGIKLSSRCATCHDGDDVHHGRFGVFCDRCHATSSFRTIRGLQ